MTVSARQSAGIEDHDDAAVAQYGASGIEFKRMQHRRNRFDHDLFGIEHAIDDQPETITAHRTHRDISRAGMGRYRQAKRFAERYERQQPAAQAQHVSLVDVLDIMTGMTADAQQLFQVDLRQSKPLGRPLRQSAPG